jgi:hypothetical protein
MVQLKEFTIDRATLCRGHLFPDGAGCRCAVGQYMGACGFGTLEALEKHFNYFVEIVPIEDANDRQFDRADQLVSLADNEPGVIAAFARIGITATYAGEYRANV